MTAKKIRKKRQEFQKSISLISRQARCRACQWASRISISWSILRTQTLRQRYSTNYSLVLVFIRICFILLLLFFLICFVYQHIIPNRDKSKQVYFFFYYFISWNFISNLFILPRWSISRGTSWTSRRRWWSRETTSSTSSTRSGFHDLVSQQDKSMKFLRI